METYPIQIGSVTRRVPLHEPFPGVRIPLVDFLGDVEFVRAVAEELLPKLPADADLLVTAETSSIPLAHELASARGLDYIVARKRRRPYMVDPIIQEVESLTLGTVEVLWLDRRYAERMLNKNIVLVMDVVASGGTMKALERMVHRAGGRVIARMAGFHQGESDLEITTVAELPQL
ncbi:adenine phosphoribosyltransferase [Oceanithermus sp.]